MIFGAGKMMMRGGFNPLTLSPALWLDASVLGLADNADVSPWTDMSGNDRHATASGTARPTFQTNELNGKAVVRFDGINDISSIGANISSKTIFMVLKQTTYKNYGILLQSGTTDGANEGLHSSSAGNYSWTSQYFSNSRVNGNSVAVPNPGSSSKMFSNFCIWSANADTWSLRSIGANGSSPAIDIAEILVFSTALSTADRQAVEAYLNSKYAIY